MRPAAVSPLQRMSQEQELLQVQKTPRAPKLKRRRAVADDSPEDSSSSLSPSSPSPSEAANDSGEIEVASSLEEKGNKQQVQEGSSLQHFRIANLNIDPHVVGIAVKQ